MARIRTIKPEVASHEGLFDLERETGLPIRFAWCVLFTVADRDGRFAWRPRTLKAQILPHDDIDFSRVLDAWVTRGFVRKYRVGAEWYGWIPTFTKHQVINNRESPSDLPPIEQADEEYQPVTDACATSAPRVGDASVTREVHAQGEGKEGKDKGTREPHVKPDKFSLPGWVPENEWVAFEESRKRLRKPMTDRARSLVIIELAKLRDAGHDPVAVLAQSVRKGWLDVFPLRDRPPAPGELKLAI